MPEEKEILDRYRARYRRQDRLFAFLNGLLSLFVQSDKPPLPPRPKRILIANAGHLGDVIVSSALFPVLRDAFPDATFDFLTGPASRAALEGHPFLNRLLILEHWRSSRAHASWPMKVARYYAQIPAMVRTLREAHYDIALDLHAWHPNYILLFRLAGIPVRAGFGRVGYEPTLTHPVAFRYDRRHELDQQLDVLRALGVSEAAVRLARPSLPPVSEAARTKAEAFIGRGVRYRVLHPASSTPRKDWVLDNWCELARRLAAKGVLPVITGAGARDAEMARAICKAEPKTLSTVGLLSWEELTAALAGAELVYSVDTSIGHVARALGRPVIALYGGMADPLHWAPIGAKVASHAEPCSPCYNKRGCPTRACLTRLTVDEVEAI